MQTIVDLPQTQLEALNALAAARNMTPSEVIAEALEGVLTSRKQVDAEPHTWENMDGLAYERKVGRS